MKMEQTELVHEGVKSIIVLSVVTINTFQLVQYHTMQ